jgi:hypothetical protein
MSKTTTPAKVSLEAPVRRALFKVIDTKHNRVVAQRVSEDFAHKQVDSLNSCGIVRYKARQM